MYPAAATKVDVCFGFDKTTTTFLQRRHLSLQPEVGGASLFAVFRLRCQGKGAFHEDLR
jgi:hypothetical protein